MSEESNTLTPEEQYRYDTIRECIDQEVTNAQAAERLGINVRQLQNLKRAVEVRGAKGIQHGLKGKTSNNKTKQSIEKKVITFLGKKNHQDFGPTFTHEKLAETESVHLTSETIRAIMIRNDIWKAKKERTKAVYRHWREPMQHYGEMLQFDGSYHDWNEDGEEECLLLGIDDATSKIPQAVFDDNEGVDAVYRYFFAYIELHGRPVAIYLDKFSTYKINHKNAVDNNEFMTQFERAMKELDIRLITAHSPQAKGRVERSFGTHQDRLVKEFRLAGIQERNAMNIFLKEIYLPKHNERFANTPARPKDMHRPLTKELRAQLPAIFSKQYVRKVQRDHTIQWHTQWFQLSEIQPMTVFPKDQVIIEERLDGSVHIRLRGKYLAYTELPERPPKTKYVVTALTSQKQPHRPPADHPWRKYKNEKKDGAA